MANNNNSNNGGNNNNSVAAQLAAMQQQLEELQAQNAQLAQQQQLAQMQAKLARAKAKNEALASGKSAAIVPPTRGKTLAVWQAAQAHKAKHGAWPTTAQLLAGACKGHNSNTVSTQLSRCRTYNG